MERQSSSVDDRPELAHHLRDERPDPQDELLDDERAKMVQRALMALDEDSRSLLLLRDWCDMSHQEIAAELGISHAAARKRYSRALSELKSALEKEKS